MKQMTLAEKVYLHSLARKEAADRYYNQLVNKYAADKELATDLGIDALAGAGAAGATYGGYKGLKALAKSLGPAMKANPEIMDIVLKSFLQSPMKDQVSALSHAPTRDFLLKALGSTAAQTGGMGKGVRSASVGLGKLSKLAKGGILGGAAIGGAGLAHLLRKTTKKEDKGILSKLGLA